jgi:hypothetical protein
VHGQRCRFECRFGIECIPPPLRIRQPENFPHVAAAESLGPYLDPMPRTGGDRMGTVQNVESMVWHDRERRQPLKISLRCAS